MKVDLFLRGHSRYITAALGACGTLSFPERKESFMAIRMPTAWVLAAALGCTVVLSSARAKPPDLPVKAQISCQVQETVTGALLIGVGVNADAGLTGSIILNNQSPPETPPSAEEEETFETIDTLCPCFFGVFQQWWQNLMGSRPAKAGSEPDGCACPYLKQPSATNNQFQDGLVEKQVSVLENLDKLQQAKKLYDLAEYYRQVGNPVTARYYYQMVRGKCPGSRYDQMATQQINELQAHQASESTSPLVIEEQEVLPAPSSEKRPRELSETSDDPWLIKFLWKLFWFGEQPSSDTPERVHGGIQESLLQPALPPLDPTTATALEKILAESGDPDMPKLILSTEGADSPEEHEPDPALGWLPGSPEEELSILVFFPEDPNSPSEGEEADDEEEDAETTEFVPDWNQVLREVTEAVSAGTCIEIDGTNLGHLRFLCQQQVGAITVRIFSDGDGVFRCVVASLDPEAGTDLRAAQRAFNDRIGHWIEELSASSSEDTWDNDDDELDDNLDLDDDEIGPAG
jgi:hypothetical protein